MVSIFTGALGSVLKSLSKWLDKLGIKIKTEFVRETRKILRKVLEC